MILSSLTSCLQVGIGDSINTPSLRELQNVSITARLVCAGSSIEGGGTPSSAGKVNNF